MKKITLLITICILSACGSKSGSDDDKLRFATTTLYYIETFTEKDVTECDESKKLDMLDRKGQLLVRVCEKVRKSCLMEGTCVVSVKNKMQMLSIDNKVQGVYRFRNITGNECKYGRGNSSDRIKSYKNMCVDPFYSVAADLKIYNLGDVIYLPSVRGAVLPNGEIHDGYFVVRDSGGGIDGYGRFDFFTGFYISKNPENPFTKLKLNGSQISPEYFVITGSESDRVRQDRNFPLLPK